MRYAPACALLGLAVAASSADATVLFALDQAGNLHSVSTLDASATLIGTGNYGAPDTASLEYNPATGQLLATTSGSTSRLWSVDPATGDATSIGSTGLPFHFEGALQFAPTGQLWGTNAGSASTPQIFTVDPTTGAATVTATLDASEADINGLAWGPGGLVGLDRVSNSLLNIDPNTGATSVLAAVPGFVGALGGMTNFQGDTAFYAVTSGDLYSVDLTTGVSALVGNVGFTPTGLAYIPTPGALATFGLAGLLGVRRRR